MATEKEANKVREQYYAALVKLGAHSVAVDIINKKTNEFCVLVFVDKPNSKIPVELEIVSGRKKIKVPVKIEMMRKFKAE